MSTNVWRLMMAAATLLIWSGCSQDTRPPLVVDDSPDRFSGDALSADISVQLSDATTDDCIDLLRTLGYRVSYEPRVHGDQPFPYTLHGTIQLVDFLTIIAEHEHLQMQVTVDAHGDRIIEGKAVP